MYDSLKPVLLTGGLQSSEAVKYKSSLDAFSQTRGSQISGANILPAVAGVLDGYDKLQMIIFGKKYGSGAA
ncbi:hypothetical protein CQW23_31427 [Capsicum baccatum]|uniref:Uncharacterized protein n=1 Tax=Capsicum baccatum TaxID=33114 RepID=A0A2G2V7L2_CAPBA|nr:hypothetical protein CQW23_31427 [Capsicum baccatum]